MNYVKELRKYVGHKPLILPGSVVCVLNERSELLMQHRLDGSWGLPGGIMELGESLEQTARREVKEETGLTIGSLNLLDVFSGEDYYLKVANGDELYSVAAVYVTKEVTGSIRVDENESIDVRYFKINDLPENLTGGTQEFLDAYLSRSITL